MWKSGKSYKCFDMISQQHIYSMQEINIVFKLFMEVVLPIAFYSKIKPLAQGNNVLHIVHIGSGYVRC